MSDLRSALRQYLAESFDGVLADEHDTEYASLDFHQAELFNEHVSEQTDELYHHVIRTIESFMADVEPLPESVTEREPRMSTDEMVKALTIAGVSEPDASLLCAIVDPSEQGSEGFTGEQRERADRALQTVLAKFSQCVSAQA